MEKSLVFSFYKEDTLLCNKYSDLSCEYFFDVDKQRVDYAMCPKNGEGIEDFLKERIFPEARVDKKRVLKSLNIPFYDVMLICKRTNGVMFDDVYWVRFPDSGVNSYKEALERVI